MDPVELIIAIAGALAAGSGATYGVQRLRNGNGTAPDPALDCEVKHDAIRGEFREAHESVCSELRDTRDSIKGEIGTLTTKIEVGFERLEAIADKRAEARVDRHEAGPYHKD